MKHSDINMQAFELGSARSVIREIFEYGNLRKKEVGAENVYDFSLGNPAVSTPRCINETIKKLVSDENFNIHGYTSAQGASEVRAAVADSLNKRFCADAAADDIYMTCGAAASLTITLGAICNEGDEVIAFAPFFPEYKVFAMGAGAVFCAVDADIPAFQLNFDDFEKKLSPKTKAVIINSPNNPSGACLTAATVERLGRTLEAHCRKYDSTVFLVTDEPYRELVYENVALPFIPAYYDNTILCYSYSKSLSLAGERIGYIYVSARCENARRVYAAVCGSGRRLGYVCAPALMQYATALNPDACADIGAYRENRDLLCNALTEYGYDCVHPDGAFYLFVRSPIGDAVRFCELARERDLLLVPSDSFGVCGYMRISYCVDRKMIEKSLSVFKELIDTSKQEN